MHTYNQTYMASYLPRYDTNKITWFLMSFKTMRLYVGIHDSIR